MAGDTPVAEERSAIQAGINPFRKRRRKKRARNYTPASTGHGAGLGVSGSKRFSYTLDTTQWPGEGRGSEIPTSELGMSVAAEFFDVELSIGNAIRRIRN